MEGGVGEYEVFRGGLIDNQNGHCDGNFNGVGVWVVRAKKRKSVKMKGCGASFMGL